MLAKKGLAATSTMGDPESLDLADVDAIMTQRMKAMQQKAEDEARTDRVTSVFQSGADQDRVCDAS